MISYRVAWSLTLNQNINKIKLSSYYNPLNHICGALLFIDGRNLTSGAVKFSLDMHLVCLDPSNPSKQRPEQPVRQPPLPRARCTLFTWAAIREENRIRPHLHDQKCVVALVSPLLARSVCHKPCDWKTERPLKGLLQCAPKL